MKPWIVAFGLLAFSAQKDVNAAAAGLGSADPASRTRAACELREFGSQAAPLIPRLAALLDDGSPVDAAVCGERTWGNGDSRRAGGTRRQATGASALVAIGAAAYEP